MKLSTKARYAVTAMMALAIHRDQGPLRLSEIASSQHISLSYLEQLFARLREEDLVKGRRGPGGGFVLAREAEQISVAEIVGAVNSENMLTTGINPYETELNAHALSKKMWSKLSHQIYDFLNGITLADFVRDAEARGELPQINRQAGRSVA